MRVRALEKDHSFYWTFFEYYVYGRGPFLLDLRRYIEFLKAKGVKFDSSEADKARFFRAFDLYGSERKAIMVTNCLPLPAGEFNVIYADPLWTFFERALGP
jgi:hypothetical protein